MTKENNDLFGLSLNTRSKIEKIFKKYQQIEKAILYGSRAKGDFKSGSDIDLTLEGASLDVDTLLKIENALDDLLLPYKIDLSLFKDLSNQDLIEHIKRVGKVFYARTSSK